MIRAGDARECVVPIVASMKSDGSIADYKDGAVGSVLCPSTLANDPDLYAVRVTETCEQLFLPTSSVLVVSPTMKIQNTDWVIMASDSGSCFARVLALNGQDATVRLLNGDEKGVALDELKRIVWIALI